ncbi:hypothetical protein [Ulvibacter litoralis]|nr:hypothetical protein [Ulvibacter litoralis]
MNEDIDIPKITNEFETFNVKGFNKEQVNGELRKSENEIFYIYLEYSKGFSEAIYPKNSYFNLTKNYYKNGNIEIKGTSFNNGSEYGIWYEFSEEGKLIKEINTDDGYSFGWKEILEYCDKKNIKLEEGYPKQGGIKTEIYKNEESGSKVWKITYYDYDKMQLIEVTLDGKTGKELKKIELELED